MLIELRIHACPSGPDPRAADVAGSVASGVVKAMRARNVAVEATVTVAPELDRTVRNASTIGSVIEPM
jgi:hypothetical protein